MEARGMSDIDAHVSKLIRDGAGKRPLPDVLADIAALDRREHEPGCGLKTPLAISSCACPSMRRKREDSVTVRYPCEVYAERDPWR